MKRLLVIGTMALWAVAVWAADARYVIRVDGLACPYCAYGVEKKLKQIEGVEHESIDINLDQGIVRVSVREGVELTEDQMRKLFNDAGFTYRSMERQSP